MKKAKKWITSIVIIMLISFLGEFLHAYIALPIPASVYGLVILFTLLCCKIIKLEWIETGADVLIAIMPLLFVPSVVKIVTLQELIANNWFSILLMIVFSTIVVMVVTGRTAQWMIEKVDKKDVE